MGFTFTNTIWSLRSGTNVNPAAIVASGTTAFTSGGPIRCCVSEAAIWALRVAASILDGASEHELEHSSSPYLALAVDLTPMPLDDAVYGGQPNAGALKLAGLVQP